MKLGILDKENFEENFYVSCSVGIPVVRSHNLPLRNVDEFGKTIPANFIQHNDVPRAAAK